MKSACRRARLLPAALAAILAVIAGVALQPDMASAAVSPVVGRGTTGVTADALPTVQVEGVVWTQVVVGNVVYAGGRFSSARPAGAAPGESVVARSNLLAFDIRTGKLITSFAPKVNGTVRDLAVSPDKKTLYLGGSFTAVNGAKRLRFAALTIKTRKLRSIAPGFNGEVRAILPTSGTVYVGGNFTKLGKKSRARLAAISASKGKLRKWNPTANGWVYALAFTPNRKSLVAGGRFTKIGKVTACGMSRIGKNGKVLSWSINTLIKDCGSNAAIMSLTSDSRQVYGTGYAYNGGNYEGVFAASGTGKVNWLQDCRGDTYDVAVANGRVYSAGHAHNCANLGGFPNSQPRQYFHALAVTASATGTLGNSPGGYKQFAGQRSPSLVNWFPSLTPGTYTGLGQAAWSVAATSKYVILGGEFTAVNGTPQQGLVRMAVPTLAPRKQGPRGVTSTSANPTSELNTDGSVTVAWPTAWDRDNDSLTYTLLRDGVAVDTRTVESLFWQQTTMSFRESNLAPETKYRWQVRVSDADGNSVTSAATALKTPS